jgi:hypothetical protein
VSVDVAETRDTFEDNRATNARVARFKNLHRAARRAEKPFTPSSSPGLTAPG